MNNMTNQPSMNQRSSCNASRIAIMAILIIAAITTAITITICATAAIPTVPSLQPDSPVVL